MLTCETCGEVLPEGTSFCPNCGMPVEHTDSAVQPDAPNAPAPDTAVPDTDSQFQQPQAAPESNPYAMPSGGSAPASGSIPEQSYPGTYPPGGNSGYGAQPNQPQSQPQPHPQQPYYGQQPQQNYGQPGNGGYIPPQQQGYPGGYPNYPQNYPNNSSNGKAIAGLVLGILSIVMGCVYGSGLLFGILGTIFSCMARKEDSSNPLQNKKNSTATSGLICSIIGIVLSVIVLLIVIIAVAVSVETGDYTTPGYYGSGDYQDACQLFFGLLR